MSDIDQLKQELGEIKHALAALKVESPTRTMLLERQAAIEVELHGSGAIAQGKHSIAAGEGSTVVTGTVVIASGSAKVVIGDEPVEIKPELRNRDLGRYLEHVIAHNRYLQLQGIRSGGKLVNIELEQIYITLRTTQQRTVQAEDEWLKQEAEFAPGEMHKRMENLAIEAVNIKVEQALAAHKHIVVLGDPGSGKTTLLRYLALLYGRDLAQGSGDVRSKLALEESGYLPILLQLRQIGAFLKVHRPQDDGTDGYAVLLDFLFQSLKNHKLDLPKNFFDEYLEAGKVVLLPDGMDEVADPDLRARVARLVESFTLAYPQCRFVVTSRVVGYSGAARLQADYAATIVSDFLLADVHEFLAHWHRLVAIGQMGTGEDAEHYAVVQTRQLMNAIEGNERVRDLAINPLMLTVIALVHRDRVKLPDRRAELYEEAVDVLLGKWDEARGVDEIRILEDRPFDAGDRKLLLQSIALYMHEHEEKEIDAAELRDLLHTAFGAMTADEAGARRAADRFLMVVEERTGLLSARGEGVYAFSHLTFQEYLAALGVAARDDYVEYILARIASPWWRETILLTAGYLSTQSKERTTKLVKAIAKNRKEPALYHNLVLASECIRDAGENRIEAKISQEVQQSLRRNLNAPLPPTARILGKWGGLRSWIDRRAEVVQALTRSGSGYWTQPFGEPEWITIPAGEFWMGEGDTDHKVYLPEYQISRVPVTNAQYALFVKATKHKTPDHWRDGRIPKGKESHPVTCVARYDAIEYCQWLSKMTGKPITLPSEAEWEKAARGTDGREYPWRGEFSSNKANVVDSGIGTTSTVGCFVKGASPYGLLDMSGNVWEWTRSLGGNYPYPSDAEGVVERENLHADSNKVRVIRGGSYFGEAWFVRCAHRFGDSPNIRSWGCGFRVVVSCASH